jgi:hypothetical protein
LSAMLPARAWQRCVLGDQDHPGKQLSPLALGEDREGAALLWNSDSKVKALGDAKLKKVALEWLHRFSVDRQDLGLQSSGIHIEIRRRGSRDEAKQHRFTRLNRKDFGIVKGAAIGK